MGTLPDHEVAKMCDSTAAIVGRYRRKHGIKAYQGYKFVKGTQPPGSKSSTTKGTRRARKSKLDPFRDEVGKLPDKIVAAKAGVSVEGVRMYRKRHGIALEPSARQPRGRKAKVKPVVESAAAPVVESTQPKRRKRRSKIDPYKSEVGVLADKIIAEKAGLSLQAVRQYRRRHNISAPPRGGAAPAVIAPEVVEAAPAAPVVEAAPAAPAVEAAPAAPVVEAAPAAPAVKAASAAPAVKAWGYSVSIRNGDNEEKYFLIATSITDAAMQSSRSSRGHVIGIQQLGPAL